MMRFLERLIRRRLPSTNGHDVPAWVKAGQLSATGSEIRYWQETGLEKGTQIYLRYLQLFGLRPSDLEGKSVADFGCGPFGGILSALPACHAAYPIDILADEYNAWGNSRHRIYRFDGGKTDVRVATCDAVFCTNAIDHTSEPELIVREVFRILRPRGKLFLHLHLRNKDQVNKIHPFPWDVEKFKRLFSDFIIDDYRVEDPDWVNDNDLEMLYARLVKPGA